MSNEVVMKLGICKTSRFNGACLTSMRMIQENKKNVIWNQVHQGAMEHVLCPHGLYNKGVLKMLYLTCSKWLHKRCRDSYVGFDKYWTLLS